MDNSLLVENRECGACTVCCVELTIEDPELVKLPGVKCQNLSKKGKCNIYPDRPETCRTWYCMWRYMPLLGEEWRPDVKGVFIKRAFNNIPPAYADKIALNFEIIGKKSGIHDIEFIEVLGGYIMQGFPCFLSIGKPRQTSRMAFLNDQLKPIIESRNLPLLKEALSSALKSCIKHSKDKMIIKDGKVVTLHKG